MREFKITIPKIEFTIKVEEVLEKKSKKKAEDYYFVTLHNHMSRKKVTILTVQDCLTVSVFTLTKLDKRNLTSNTIYGYNDIIALNKVVFGSRKLNEVTLKISKDRIRILNDLKKYSDRLLEDSIVDIVSLNTKKVICSYNLAIGREVVN